MLVLVVQSCRSAILHYEYRSSLYQRGRPPNLPLFEGSSAARALTVNGNEKTPQIEQDRDLRYHIDSDRIGIALEAGLKVEPKSEEHGLQP